jgi:hypothetical protein
MVIELYVIAATSVYIVINVSYTVLYSTTTVLFLIATLFAYCIEAATRAQQ